MRRLCLLVVALGLVAAACTSGPSDPAASAGASGMAEPWGEGRPADQLVLQVDTDHQTLDSTLTFPPTYSIYADGTVYFLGAPTPGSLPLLKTITSAQLDDAQLAHLSSLMDDMGLREVSDFIDVSRSFGGGGDSWTIDGVTTTATYVDRDGDTHSYGVYDLWPGIEAPESKVLSTLVTDLRNMTAAATDRVDLPPERLRLHWRRDRSYNANRPKGAEALPWPLAIAPQDFTEVRKGHWCTVLSGDEARAAAEKLTNAEWESRFTHNDRGYRLVGRALLPGEDGCAPA